MTEHKNTIIMSQFAWPFLPVAVLWIHRKIFFEVASTYQSYRASLTHLASVYLEYYRDRIGLTIKLLTAYFCSPGNCSE